MKVRAIATIYLNQGVSFKQVQEWLEDNIPSILKNVITITRAVTEMPDGTSLKTVTTVLDGVEAKNYLDFAEMENRDKSIEPYGVIRRMIDTDPSKTDLTKEIPLPECVFWQVGWKGTEIHC